MPSWKESLPYDPVPYLRSFDNPALDYFTCRDLLAESPGLLESLWHLPQPSRLLQRQRPDGSWSYPGKASDPGRKYAQVETYRNLGVLVEKYAFDRRHEAIAHLAEFLFSCQTHEGDIRGIYGTQYTPNYTAAMLELLIKAGYIHDERIEKGFSWLLSMRQEDGGWAIPITTASVRWAEAELLPKPLQPDPQRPFSHMVTGVVLRAFVAHPRWKSNPETRHAGELLLSRLFERDAYRGRGDKAYWEATSFPFWFTDIVSALDSLSILGFTREDARLQAALDWLAARQQPDGSFDLRLLRSAEKDTSAWVALAICRIFKRLYASR